MTSRELLKRREIICDFKKCFRKDYSENKEHYLKAASRRSKPDTRFRYVVWSCPKLIIKKITFGRCLNSKKHIKKHKIGAHNHDYLKESSRN